MRVLGMAAGWLLGAAVLCAMAFDEGLDRFGDALRFEVPGAQLGGRLSGTLDLEAYAFQQPPQTLLYTEGKRLFNPRLSLFADVAAGEALYAFVQVRADRGFDPSDERLELRLDEYAVRLTPFSQRVWSLQLGKFATVVGSWARHHRSWEDPFITAPVPYGTLTPMWDGSPARSFEVVRHWAHFPPSKPTYEDFERQVPLIWGPSYTTGAALMARFEHLSLDLELKNAAVSSRPESWDPSAGQWRHPSVGGRIGYSPSPTWSFGFSFSGGAYLVPRALAGEGGPYGVSDYKQYLAGSDVTFAHHHLQVRAELIANRFEVPGVGGLDAMAGYVEGAYRFSPAFSAAVRWGALWYERVEAPGGERLPWGHDTVRIDLAPTWRLSAHLQLKLQYSLQRESDSDQTWNQLGAAQLTLRF